MRKDSITDMKKCNINIEIASDTTEIYRLLRRFDCVFPHLCEKVNDYNAFAEKLAKYATVCVAKDNGAECGLIVFYANDYERKVAYITLVGLLPEYQGKSLGGVLIDHCADIAAENGMQTIRLEVDLDNERAIKFYEKHGFVRCALSTNTSMYMEKRIGI